MTRGRQHDYQNDQRSEFWTLVLQKIGHRNPFGNRFGGPLECRSYKHQATQSMVHNMRRIYSLALAWFLFGVTAAADEQPLPSWHDGSVKQTIMQFVERVTKPDSADYVPASERIATFDNDGTLWCEQPMYVQGFFALDRVAQLASDHPEWKTEEPFASVLRGDSASAMSGGHESLLKLLMGTHTGMSTEEFDRIADEWIRRSHHPETGRLFTEMVYQPMLELLDYLRSNGFKTYIVSGGGIDFMRPWVEQVYGIPPEQVIGSSVKTQFEIRDDSPVIVRLPEMDFVDDKAGKPVAIQSRIGRRPILAVGNSDGDFEMLQWTTAGEGPRLGLIVRHTDAQREYAYDRESTIGRLDRALDEGNRLGWTFIDMKRDWSQVFPMMGEDDAVE